MKEKQRDFKGIWIPKDIYLAEELSWTQKILLVEIDSLDKGEGCFASNKYFGQFLHKSEGQIANAITELRKKGWLITRRFDGRKRYISLKAGFRKTLKQGSGKPEGRVQENLKHINIDNNTINNIYNRFCKKFNRNPNTYKLTTSRRNKIKTRLKEFSPNQILKAIDNTSEDSFYSGTNDRGWTADLDYITRSYEITERLINLTPRRKNNQPYSVDKGKYDDIVEK